MWKGKEIDFLVLMRAKARAAVLASYPTDTATGSPASFPDGADGVPVEDLTAAIGIAQSGSGTPSPANVRPITPWTGLTLSHSGADTSDPEELAVSWADAAGHVWAGTLDVTTGVLTELYYDASGDALGAEATGNTPNNTVQARFVPDLQDFSSVNSDIISDRFATANGSGQSGMIARVSTGGSIWVYLNIPQSEMSGTTTEDVQAWTGEKKPVILLKRTTPVTYQLPPHAVKTLLGENNYWADTGAVTVDYRADLDLYIEKKTGDTGTLSLGAAPSVIRPGAGLEMQPLGLDDAGVDYINNLPDADEYLGDLEDDEDNYPEDAVEDEIEEEPEEEPEPEEGSDDEAGE